MLYQYLINCLIHLKNGIRYRVFLENASSLDASCFYKWSWLLVKSCLWWLLTNSPFCIIYSMLEFYLNLIMALKLGNVLRPEFKHQGFFCYEQSQHLYKFYLFIQSSRRGSDQWHPRKKRIENNYLGRWNSDDKSHISSSGSHDDMK